MVQPDHRRRRHAEVPRQRGFRPLPGIARADASSDEERRRALEALHRAGEDRAAIGANMSTQTLTSEARADALEEKLMKEAHRASVRRGVGLLFGGITPSGAPVEIRPLPAMPARPTLV